MICPPYFSQQKTLHVLRIKPQLDPVCGHFPLPKENKVTGSDFDVLFLENPISFIGVTFPCTQNVTKERLFDTSL
jgi:hypothetical protein